MLQPHENEFSGKVVCIAGASRGIGRGVAERFAQRGACLLLLARSEEVLEVACHFGADETAAVRCDIRDFDAVQRAIQGAAARWGRVDVLVNTAAVLGSTGLTWETKPEDWESAVSVNLIGTYNTMRAALPYMIEARQGKVINFAGGGAAYGYPRFSAYAASKVAVVRLSETVALEGLPYNVQVNVVAPGAIETELLQKVRAAGGDVRTVSTLDLALDLVEFLASDGASHLTGRFIHARDSYRQWQTLRADSYTLRRVEQ